MQILWNTGRGYDEDILKNEASTAKTPLEQSGDWKQHASRESVTLEFTDLYTNMVL